MSRRPDRRPELLPPLVQRVIHAAAHHHDDGSERAGHAGCLEELSVWALAAVPTRGVLSPSDDGSYRVIADASRRWLKFGAAAREVQSALEGLRKVGADPEPLLEAARWQQGVGEEAYYYAGLACGLTLAAIGQVVPTVVRGSR